MDTRKYFTLIILFGILTVYFDYYFGRFAIREFGTPIYHSIIYPIFLLSLWLPLSKILPWKRVLGGLIMTNALNDILWFLVSPEGWINLWGFEGKWLWDHYILLFIKIRVTDTLMTIWTISRILAFLLLLVI